MDASVQRRPVSRRGGGVRYALPLALVASGCAGGSPPHEASRPAPDCESFASRGLLPAVTSRAALREQLGDPSSVRKEAVDNRHVAGQVDTLVTYAYPHLSATFYALPDRDLPSWVEVSDRRWLRFSAPTIGDAPARVRALLGDPESEDETGDGGLVWGYSCAPREGAEEPFFLVMRNDGVASVRFTYYVD